MFEREQNLELTANFLSLHRQWFSNESKLNKDSVLRLFTLGIDQDIFDDVLVAMELKGTVSISTDMKDADAILATRMGLKMSGLVCLNLVSSNQHRNYFRSQVTVQSILSILPLLPIGNMPRPKIPQIHLRYPYTYLTSALFRGSLIPCNHCLALDLHLAMEADLPCYISQMMCATQEE